MDIKEIASIGSLLFCLSFIMFLIKNGKGPATGWYLIVVICVCVFMMFWNSKTIKPEGKDGTEKRV